MGNTGYRNVAIKTDGAGAATVDIAFRGPVRAIRVEVGDLSTPDFEITDEPAGTNILTVAGVAADANYYPQVATTDPADGTAGDDFTSPVVFGKLRIAVTGGGASKSGLVRIVGE